ncbi:MAG TPA: c-type cytochrome [Candidatus Acidoferrum sp.]|nr:c-type cytochrome [Candidatus Acidoferrum sp.]
MRNFLLGVVLTLLVLVLGALWCAKTGRINFEADNAASDLERRLAMSAVDAGIEHRAPDVKNPVAATEQNLVAGAQLYLNHCAGCHGTPSNPDSQFARSFNPPVPRFFKDPPDMPDNQNFYVAQHGIRWSGMPAWNQTLSENQIWQIVTFMSNIERLPPAAKAVFDTSAPAAAPPASR